MPARDESKSTTPATINPGPAPATPLTETAYTPAERERVKKAFPVAVAQDGDEHLVAALAGVSLDRVNVIIERHGDELRLAVLKFQGEGKDIEVLARRTQAALVRRIAAVADQVSPEDAAEYLRPVSKIIENFDKVRLAERETDKFANLPVINFTIGPGMALTYSPAPAGPDMAVTHESSGQAVAGSVPEVADARVVNLDARPVGPSESESWD